MGPPRSRVEEEAFNATADEGFAEETFAEEEIVEEVVKRIDPAIYLGILTVVVAIVWFLMSRKRRPQEDDFFAELDIEKVSRAGSM